MSVMDTINEKLNTLLFTSGSRLGVYNVLMEMLSAGISLPDAVRKYVEGKKAFGMGGDAEAFVMEKVYNNLSGGNSGVRFSKSVAKFIPEDEFMIIFASEENGNLIEGLAEAINLVETKTKLSSTIRGAVVVPVVLVLVTFVLMGIVQLNIMPIVGNLLPYEKWPDIAKTLNSLSAFFLYKGGYLLGGVGLLIFIFTKMSAVYTNKTIRPILDKLPLFSHYKQMVGASFLLSVSAMLGGGTSFSDTLRTLHKYSSPYLRGYIKKSITIQSGGGKKGGNGECLNTGLFNNDISFSISVYGDLPDFEKALKIISVKSSDNLLANVTLTLGLLNKLSMVFILIIIISMLMMMTELGGAMR